MSPLPSFKFAEAPDGSRPSRRRAYIGPLRIPLRLGDALIRFHFATVVPLHRRYIGWRRPWELFPEDLSGDEGEVYFIRHDLAPTEEAAYAHAAEQWGGAAYYTPEKIAATHTLDRVVMREKGSDVHKVWDEDSGGWYEPYADYEFVVVDQPEGTPGTCAYWRLAYS